MSQSSPLPKSYQKQPLQISPIAPVIWELDNIDSCLAVKDRNALIFSWRLPSVSRDTEALLANVIRSQLDVSPATGMVTWQDLEAILSSRVSLQRPDDFASILVKGSEDFKCCKVGPCCMSVKPMRVRIHTQGIQWSYFVYICHYERSTHNIWVWEHSKPRLALYTTNMSDIWREISKSIHKLTPGCEIASRGWEN